MQPWFVRPEAAAVFIRPPVAPPAEARDDFDDELFVPEDWISVSPDFSQAPASPDEEATMSEKKDFQADATSPEHSDVEAFSPLEYTPADTTFVSLNEELHSRFSVTPEMPSDDEYEPSEVNSSDTPYDEESPSPVGSPDSVVIRLSFDED